MFFASPLEPYVELGIIYIVIKYFSDKFKDYSLEINWRKEIKEDIEKLKKSV